MKYEFTNSWFESVARGSWDIVFDTLRPQRVLEVGSWEGASAVYAIEKIEKYGGGRFAALTLGPAELNTTNRKWTGLRRGLQEISIL